jgi:hypothetical protein
VAKKPYLLPSSTTINPVEKPLFSASWVLLTVTIPGGYPSRRCQDVNTLAFLGRVCLSTTPGQEPEIELALV